MQWVEDCYTIVYVKQSLQSPIVKYFFKKAGFWVLLTRKSEGKYIQWVFVFQWTFEYGQP